MDQRASNYYIIVPHIKNKLHDEGDNNSITNATGNFCVSRRIVKLGIRKLVKSLGEHFNTTISCINSPFLLLFCTILKRCIFFLSFFP